MPRSRTPLLLLALAVAAAPPAAPAAAYRFQTEVSPVRASDEVFRQLLSLPAPTPRTAQAEVAEGAGVDDLPVIRREGPTPPDDAPPEELVAYWGRWAVMPGRRRQEPSETVRGRLLAACEAAPELLPRLLPVLGGTREAAGRVRKLYDAAQSDGRFDDGWRESVREWLKFNTGSFLDDLLGEARQAADKEGYVDKEEALSALARVDPESAAPLLESFAGGDQPRAAALALALLHRHALESKDSGAAERHRARLRAIAADRAAPARARDTAVGELSAAEWPGRDDWYLSLFADETLIEPSDGRYAFHPLTEFFDRDPDRWIPVLSKLVESKDAAVRRNAAACLVRYATVHPRRDAILPVLRWLSDPDWLGINGTDRVRFVHAMRELDVPESVPGLIWIVEHEEGHRHWAARTLARYKDPRAVPALRKALAETKHEAYRTYIVEGLIASGGVSEAEQLAALEAYAARLAADGGPEELKRHPPYGDDSRPLAVSIGSYLAGRKEAPEAFVRAVLERAEGLGRRNPALARALLGVAEGWQARQVDLDVLRRVGEGSADAATVAGALGRRERLRESVGHELHLLVGAGGAAQGVAAVILEDEALAQSILAADDEAAQLALLACARLTQTPLPVAQVGPLLASKRATLALAAERYLLAEDGAEARELLWARHPGEAFITGWREATPLTGGYDSSALDASERKLRAELFARDGAPIEIFALLERGGRPRHVLRVYAGRAVYTFHEDDARYREREVTAEELSVFKQSVAALGLPDSGPRFGPCHYDCFGAEFLSLRRERGRRVYIHQGLTAQETLLDTFGALGREGMTVHYRLAEQVAGLEILLADRSLSVLDVWQRGPDLRVLVERPETPEEAARRQAAEGVGGDGEDEAARAERRRVERALARARVSWRAFADGRPGATAPRPEAFSVYGEAAPDVDDEEFPSHLNEHLAQAAAGQDYVLAGGPAAGGLWRKGPGQRPVRVSLGEGVYANPLVTPDGAWAVAAKAGTDWAGPNDVIRFDLRAGREYRVGLPPAEQFEPVAYVAAHGRVLLRRARDEGGRGEAGGPVAPEFYLLDAAAGRTQPVSGVFEPLLRPGDRPLQPAGRPDEFWAAVPDRRKNETRVGRYSARDFSFRTLLVVPHLSFGSGAMWVDEAGAKLYVVYEGQLLRLPLPAAR